MLDYFNFNSFKKEFPELEDDLLLYFYNSYDYLYNRYYGNIIINKYNLLYECEFTLNLFKSFNCSIFVSPNLINDLVVSDKLVIYTKHKLYKDISPILKNINDLMFVSLYFEYENMYCLDFKRKEDI